MSFYSYKNANPSCCPGTISGNVLDGLDEKICIQVQRVYDSCLQQEQLTNVDVTITSYAQVVNTCCCNSSACCGNETETVPPTSAPVPPITFESCRSSTMDVDIGNLSVERLCDRPCFARVRGIRRLCMRRIFLASALPARHAVRRGFHRQPERLHPLQLRLRKRLRLHPRPHQRYDHHLINFPGGRFARPPILQCV